MKLKESLVGVKVIHTNIGQGRHIENTLDEKEKGEEKEDGSGREWNVVEPIFDCIQGKV